MSDYIERKSIRDMYSCLDPNARVLVGQVLIDIDAIPPAEVYPKGSDEAELAYAEGFANGEEAERSRAKGKWIEDYNGNGWNDYWDYTCSNCGKRYERADAVLCKANFCPNCGADMRGADDEDN